MPNVNKLLGIKIRRLREKKGQTQNELAFDAGISLKHLGELERGRGNPPLNSLQGIASALSLSLSELFDFEDLQKSEAQIREEVMERIKAANIDLLLAMHKALRP